MSDFNSSMPVRTEQNGDVVAKLVDFTTNTQGLAIDAAGLVGAKLFDVAGVGVTSQVNGAQQALDVGINVAGVQIDPRSIRALTSADVVTAEQGTSPWVVSGTVAVTQSTSPWLTQDAADGPVAPGTAASLSILIGGQYNATLPTLTDGQQAAIQVDSSGRLLISAVLGAEDRNWGVVGAGTLRTAAEIGNATGAADFDYGAVGAQTLRTAAEIGNATGAADFDNGATGAQTLRVAANLAVAGADVSVSNPVPVVISSSVPGTAVENYKDATAIAVAASDNHDYTVTAGKTLNFARVWASASGKMKIEVQVETGVATGTFVTKFVGFNSTATPNIDITIYSPIIVAAGVRVRIVTTNKDNQAQDLYSTIEGTEV